MEDVIRRLDLLERENAKLKENNENLENEVKRVKGERVQYNEWTVLGETLLEGAQQLADWIDEDGDLDVNIVAFTKDAVIPKEQIKYLMIPEQEWRTPDLGKSTEKMEKSYKSMSRKMDKEWERRNLLDEFDFPVGSIGSKGDHFASATAEKRVWKTLLPLARVKMILKRGGADALPMELVMEVLERTVDEAYRTTYEGVVRAQLEQIAGTNNDVPKAFMTEVLKSKLDLDEKKKMIREEKRRKTEEKNIKSTSEAMEAMTGAMKASRWQAAPKDGGEKTSYRGRGTRGDRGRGFRGGRGDYKKSDSSQHDAKGGEEN
jgi:hypothetical protein